MHLLIVDDQQRTRQSLALLFKTLPGISQIQEAEDGLKALEIIRGTRPQIVIMDARMPRMDGLEAVLRIKEKWPEIKVIILSMYLEYQETALTAGADAFVSKGEPPEKLLEAVCAFL